MAGFLINGFITSMKILTPPFFLILPIICSLLLTSVLLRAPDSVVEPFATSAASFGLLGTLMALFNTNNSPIHSTLGLAILTTAIGLGANGIASTILGLRGLISFLRNEA